MCTGLSEVLIHNEKSSQILGVFMYMYTKLQTQWHIRCCQR